MTRYKLFKITQRLFEEYGFITYGRYYHLDLPDVLVTATLDHPPSYYGKCYELSYNLSIKALHANDEMKPNDIFTGYDAAGLISTVKFNPNDKRHERAGASYCKYFPIQREIKQGTCFDTEPLKLEYRIYYEELREEEYINDIRERLHRYFDPFKENALEYIKEQYNLLMSGRLAKRAEEEGDLIGLRRSAVAFLGLSDFSEIVQERQEQILAYYRPANGIGIEDINRAISEHLAVNNTDIHQAMAEWLKNQKK